MPPRRPNSVAQWLTAAGRAGIIQVTPRTIVAVERLLRTQKRWEPDELASRLASLLAEDGESWQRIYRHCRDTLEFRAPTLAAVVNIAVRHWLLRIPGWIWATVLVGFIVTAATLGPRALTTMRHKVAQTMEELLRQGGSAPVRGWLATLCDRASHRPQPQPATPDPEKVVPPRPTVRVEQLAPEKLVPLDPAITFVDPPADERLSSGWLALWIAVSAALAGLAARWWWFAVADYQRTVEQAAVASEAEQDELMRQVDRVRAIYFIAPVLPLPRGDIDEAATILARMSAGEPGRELDVSPTMRRTIDAGGRFSPVYARSPAGETLLVLVDIETNDGHVFLDGVNQLLAAWQRGGLRFDRYDFKGSPGRLTAGKRSFTLDHLIQRHEEAPVLLFSRLLDARDIDLELTWMLRLRAWSRRAWIDLDPCGVEGPERRAVADEAERAGLVRFPFTREGLLACARELAQGQLRGGQTRETDLPEAFTLHEALELWAACAACVPDPTWTQLAAVREQIPALADLLPDPRLLGRLLERLHGRGWLEAGAERGQGERLLLTEHGVAELLVQLRRYDAGRAQADSLERMTRTLLIQQLLAADVEGDPYSAVRQQLKLRFHRAMLDEQDVAALLELGDGAVADELRRMLAVEGRVQAQQGGQRWSRATLARATASVGEAQTTSIAVLAPSTWSRGHVRVFLAAAGLALTSWTSVWALGGLAPPQTRETTAQWLREPVHSRVTLDPPLRPDLVAIRGGKFRMGSSVEEQDRARAEAVAAYGDAAEDLYRDEARHDAEVSDFELCRTEVTQGQWRVVMEVSKLQPSECGDETCEDEKPITDVTWFEAVEYMNRLTQQENKRRSAGDPLSLCYVKESAEEVRWERSCTGYRLPTEAEWEYAARAGSETGYFFGDDPKKMCEHGNVADLTAKAKYPDWAVVECDDKAADLARVGSYRPNSWGLYDVHGNAWEWVWDWHADYIRNPPVNYAGPATGSVRVLRGGSFGSEPASLRSALRHWNAPAVSNRNDGLRCARGPHPQP